MPRNKEFDYTEKLETVRDLFWEKGYNATSMHDIVEITQLNRSSIYNTYGNKHKLFLECLANYARMKTIQYKEVSNRNAKTFDFLSYTVHDLMNQTIKDKKACLITRTIFELGDSDKEIKNLITNNAKVLEEIFRELINQAKLTGEIRKDVKSELVAKYILSSFSGFYKHYILSRNKKEVNEMIDFMLQSIKA